MNDPINKLYFELMKRLEGEMEEAFGRMWRRYLSLPASANQIEIAAIAPGALGSPQYWRPSADMFETEDEFIIHLEIAGLDQDSLRISQSVEGRRLWLQGERRDETKDVKGQTWYHQLEIYYGPFELPILLPPGIQLELEEIGASYHDGILILRIPKKSARNQQKKEKTLSIPIEDD
jgi:HSP20 family protein